VRARRQATRDPRKRRARSTASRARRRDEAEAVFQAHGLAGMGDALGEGRRTSRSLRGGTTSGRAEAEARPVEGDGAGALIRASPLPGPGGAMIPARGPFPLAARCRSPDHLPHRPGYLTRRPLSAEDVAFQSCGGKPGPFPTAMIRAGRPIGPGRHDASSGDPGAVPGSGAARGPPPRSKARCRARHEHGGPHADARATGGQRVAKAARARPE
jgi:hypothetical protein